MSSLITILIIVATVLISMAAFSNSQLMAKYQLNPYQVYYRKEWHRMLTHGFIHVDWTHLIFNMLTLFFFGRYVEAVIGNGVVYILFYLSAIVVSSMTTLFKHKDNYLYNAVGASGGVSAMLFASILFNPNSKIIFLFFPVPIPGFVFGLIYIAYSHYMSRKESDNINHDAHLLGALYGFAIPLLFNLDYIKIFINQIFN
jgi:membrane associated rhomboid family serine protease